MSTIADIVEDSDVLLRAPDGYTLRGTFIRYIPEIQRYQFSIKIGNGDGTTVMFHRATMDKYTIVPDPEEDRYPKGN